jgi:hypothetical protein
MSCKTTLTKTELNVHPCGLVIFTGKQNFIRKHFVLAYPFMWQDGFETMAVKSSSRFNLLAPVLVIAILNVHNLCYKNSSSC